MMKYLPILFLLFSCNQIKKQPNDSLKKDSNAQSMETIEDLKSYNLKDTINYTDFNITLNYSNNFAYSSYDSICWNLYKKGKHKIKFGLTKNEKRQIFEAMKKNDFLSLPNIIIEAEDTCTLPCFSTEISIRIGNLNHRVYYSGYCNIKDKYIKIKFMKINDLISQIINNKKEVKALPESDIIYF